MHLLMKSRTLDKIMGKAVKSMYVHGDIQNEKYVHSRNAQGTLTYSVYAELTI